MADTPIKERDPIAGLQSILDLYSGKQKVTTTAPETTTETTRSNLTADQINSQVQMAMAPLNQASHANGLSTYSDTTLALGRGQVAADIAAKNAGSTRTVTSSGRTTTESTPGALSSSRIGDTAQSLLLNQLLMPTAKKVLNPMTTMVSDAIGKGADAIINPVTDFFSGGAPAGSLAAVDSTGASTDVLGDFIASGMKDTAVSSGGDLLAGIGTSISTGWDNLKELLGFAEGGLVDVSDEDSYASGGYVDRNLSTTNLVPQSAGKTTLSANGEIDPASVVSSVPTVADTARNPILAQTSSSSMRRDPAEIQKQIDSLPPEYQSKVNKELLGTGALAAMNATGVGALYTTLAGALNKIGLSDLPTASNQLMKAIKTATEGRAVQGELSDRAQAVINAGGVTIEDVNKDGSRTNPATGATTYPVNGGSTQMTPINSGAYVSPVNDGGRSTIVSTNLGTLSSEGSSGESDNGSHGYSMAEGGAVSGPGTSTSDSVAAHLSDGEYVIDAKTVAALGPEFFQAIQAHFNPSAIKSQAAKGRI